MEKADRPEHVADLFEQGLSRIEPNACNIPRTQEISRRHRAAARFYAELCKTVEHDPGEQCEIANDEGEEADIEHLLQKAGDHICVLAQRPKQTCQRDIDRDQRGREISNIPRQQAEAAIDVRNKGRKEGVDDVH